MSLSTANSSFIFDLRLRSITLCAVFLAIFFPATLVELGCFFVVAFDDPGVPFLLEALGRAVCILEALEGFRVGGGFICMIFRERVGGGGNEKSAFPMAGRIGCGFELRPLLFAGAMAGEGNSKASSLEACNAPSLPGISEEEAGVGGKFSRAIVNQD